MTTHTFIYIIDRIEFVVCKNMLFNFIHIQFY